MLYFSGKKKYSLESTEGGLWEVHVDDGEVQTFKTMTDAMRYLISRVCLSDQRILDELIKSDKGVDNLLYLEVSEVLSLMGKSTRSKSNLKRDHKAIYEKSTKIGHRNVLSLQNVKRLINGEG